MSTLFLSPSLLKNEAAQSAGAPESVVEAPSVKPVRKGLDGVRSLSLLLLAALVSTLAMAADQLVDTWADQHLFAAWVVLWLVVFTTIAVAAPKTRLLADAMVQGLNAWSRRVASERADARMWAAAQRDPRVMAEIRAAAMREGKELPASATTSLVRDNRYLAQAPHLWRV